MTYQEILQAKIAAHRSECERLKTLSRDSERQAIAQNAAAMALERALADFNAVQDKSKGRRKKTG